MRIKGCLDHHERPLILGFVLAAFLTAVYDRWPQHTDTYTVTLKDKCLKDEGTSFTMDYKGWGSVKFLIVPPNATTSQKGVKE